MKDFSYLDTAEGKQAELNRLLAELVRHQQVSAERYRDLQRALGLMQEALVDNLFLDEDIDTAEKFQSFITEMSGK